MSESDTDFEMLEKRLSDLNPDELILVMDRTIAYLCSPHAPVAKLCIVLQVASAFSQMLNLHNLSEDISNAQSERAARMGEVRQCQWTVND